MAALRNWCWVTRQSPPPAEQQHLAHSPRIVDGVGHCSRHITGMHVLQRVIWRHLEQLAYHLEISPQRARIHRHPDTQHRPRNIAGCELLLDFHFVAGVIVAGRYSVARLHQTGGRLRHTEYSDRRRVNQQRLVDTLFNIGDQAQRGFDVDVVRQFRRTLCHRRQHCRQMDHRNATLQQRLEVHGAQVTPCQFVVQRLECVGQLAIAGVVEIHRQHAVTSLL
jgi:hypothetical protein